MELDDENESFFHSLDLKPLSANETSSETNLFESSLLANGSSSFSSSTSTDACQLRDAAPRRYNLRRNSDFPSSSSSSHSSRSAEYLQVPLSKSQQRLSSPSSSSSTTVSTTSPRLRDIREARMDQIIFRLIEPSFASSTRQPVGLGLGEPTINISSADDPTASVVGAAAAAAVATITRPSTEDLPATREVKSYSRSKTAPLAFSTAKKYEAKDLCGTSSNDSNSK